MKRVFISTLATVLCMAVALPAMAEVMLSGQIGVDYFYLHRDGNIPTPNGNELDRLFLSTPSSYNRLTAEYANDENTIRGLIEMRGGEGFGGLEEVVFFNYAWIDWQLTPTQFFRFGLQTQTFAIMSPQQKLGPSAWHSDGIGFGDIHGSISTPGVRYYHRFSDSVRMRLALYDPNNDSAEIVGISPAFPPSSPTTTKREENTIPRFDMEFRIDSGNWRIVPSGTWLRQEYEGVGGNAQDHLDIWGFAVGVSYGGLKDFFVFNGEFTVGENLGAGNYAGAGTAVPSFYVDSAGRAFVADAETISWWAQIGLKVGRSRVFFIAGRISSELDNDTGIGLRTKLYHSMYGISWPFYVAKLADFPIGLWIRPELMFYDWGDSAVVRNVPTKYAKEVLAGVKVVLIF